MHGEPSARELEGWLLAVSDVLAVLLSGSVSEEERARCKGLLASWSHISAAKAEHVPFQVETGRDGKLPGRQALPALFALLDE